MLVMLAQSKTYQALARLVAPPLAIVAFAAAWVFMGLEQPRVAKTLFELRGQSPVYFWVMYLTMFAGVAINFQAAKATNHAREVPWQYWLFLGPTVAALALPFLPTEPSVRPKASIAQIHVSLCCLGYLALLDVVERLLHRLR
jgi:hypothetical protein